MASFERTDWHLYISCSNPKHYHYLALFQTQTQLQKLAVRLMTTTKPMFVGTNILSIQDYVVKLNVSLVHDILNNVYPIAVQQSMHLEYLYRLLTQQGRNEPKENVDNVRTAKYGRFTMRYHSGI